MLGLGFKFRDWGSGFIVKIRGRFKWDIWTYIRLCRVIRAEDSWGLGVNEILESKMGIPPIMETAK